MAGFKLEESSLCVHVRVCGWCSVLVHVPSQGVWLGGVRACVRACDGFRVSWQIMSMLNSGGQDAAVSFVLTSIYSMCRLM